jgi:hypothetical protein
MTDLRTAAQQALEALEKSETWVPDEGFGMLRLEAQRKHEAAITALRAALEQPEQAEPVAWRTFDGEGGYDYRTYDDNENYRDEWDKRNPNHKGWVEPLYTHPPRREWQGLSEEEFGYIYVRSATHEEFARAVEAALRSKNHD